MYIPLSFVPNDPVLGKSVQAQVMAWCWTGAVPLPNVNQGVWCHMSPLGHNELTRVNSLLSFPILLTLFMTCNFDGNDVFMKILHVRLFFKNLLMMARLKNEGHCCKHPNNDHILQLNFKQPCCLRYSSGTNAYITHNERDGSIRLLCTVMICMNL